MAADPYTLAADLLDRVVAFFDAAGVDLPALRYVAPGDSKTIAYDGPAVMVSMDLVGAGQPGVDRANIPAFPLLLVYAQFAVSILREAAVQDETGNPPSAETIQADAQANITDAVTLHRALYAVLAGCEQPGGWVGPRTPLAVGQTVPVGPQGAVMAVVGTVQVALL